LLLRSMTKVMGVFVRFYFCLYPQSVLPEQYFCVRYAFK
jgi:hypothetical protein